MVKAADGSQIKRTVPVEGIDVLSLLGFNDQNLRMLETMFECEAYLRGSELILVGDKQAVRDMEQTVFRMISAVQEGRSLAVGEIGEIARGVREGAYTEAMDGESQSGGVYLTGLKKVVKPRGPVQKKYLKSIMDNDIVVGIGPAGTGKTYLAVAAAIDHLNKKRVKRIILARPAVEAGEKLGFLPGDMQEKVDPYLRPLYDALNDMMNQENLLRCLDNGTVEIAPIAYMRGRTLHEAFVILDEAQNATRMQMKMFLTRLGVSSKAVITGDKTQIDLPTNSMSGLVQIEDILRGIDGIDICYFDDADVVRHRLVKDIIRAYREAEESEKQQDLFQESDAESF